MKLSPSPVSGRALPTLLAGILFASVIVSGGAGFLWMSRLVDETGRQAEVIRLSVEALDGSVDAQGRGRMNDALAAQAAACAQGRAKIIASFALMAGGLVALIALAAFLGRRHARTIIRPLVEIDKLIDAYFPSGKSGEEEKGDFSPMRIAAKLDEFITFTLTAIKELKDTTGKLLESVDTMSQVLDSLSKQASKQSEAADGDLATIQRISAMIVEISEGADEQQINLGILIVRILDFTKIIQSINTDLKQQIVLINRISEVSGAGKSYLDQLSGNMEKINTSSRQMTEILELINDISDRINLLSLNAAIESARAGEHGRGFAVVADEISKLADQTARSIKDIDSLIKRNSVEIADSMDNAANTVKTIATMVEGVGTIREMMDKSYTRIEAQIQNNYMVTQESKEIGERGREVNFAIARHKEELDLLVSSISNIKESSQYFSYLTGRIVNNSQDLISSASTLKGTIDSFLKIKS
ncbi:MAG: hypothetical protein EPN93_09515 [Spirochaetes bacterium]|nr:MAG: hypothetical protein EPN93_09515 [Spirochaetota bacterium]